MKSADQAVTGEQLRQGHSDTLSDTVTVSRPGDPAERPESAALGGAAGGAATAAEAAPRGATAAGPAQQEAAREAGAGAAQQEAGAQAGAGAAQQEAGAPNDAGANAGASDDAAREGAATQVAVPDEAMLEDAAHPVREAGNSDTDGDARPAPDGATPLTPGALVDGRYRMGRRIGAGGMATILQARDETLERDVAVKVIHAHLADDPVVLARFRTEARHAAALVHPNIVNVYDQGVAGLPYIVMEHIGGPSLREVLLARGRLSPGEALAVVVPVCDALSRAHAAGVVHRDLKPENVLITLDGIPKVADFGIARAMAATSHTQTGSLIGSVHYLAPELVDGAEASAASDQYALGVVLFELLTGRKALPAESPMAVALRHAQERIPAPSEYVSDVPEAVDDVVATATAPDPDDRYPDLAAFAAALREAVPEGPRAVVVTDLDQRHLEHTLVIAADSHDTASLEAVGDVETRRTVPARRRISEAAPSARSSRSQGASKQPAQGATVWSGWWLWARWRRRPWFAVAAILGVCLIAVGSYGLYWNYVMAPFTEVPPVEDLTAAQASATLEDLGFAFIADGEPVHSVDEPEGEVLEQTPAPGESLRRGDAVSVIVSAGPAPVDVGEYVGLTREQALAALETAVLEASISEEFDRAPAGEVIAQDPDPGTTLRQTDTVALTVSKGIEQVTVPDLSGMTREEAEQALADARLHAEFTTEFSDEVPEAGTVISQDLDAESSVDVNSVVAVAISDGPLTIPMPNVRGEGVDAATAELEELGFIVSVEGQPRPSFGPIRQGQIGLVEEQLPSPEKPIERGSPVTLYTFNE